MYATFDGRTLLSVVQTYGREASDARSAKSTTDIHGTTRHMLLFGIPFE
jgi:hypothetical protein